MDVFLGLGVEALSRALKAFTFGIELEDGAGFGNKAFLPSLLDEAFDV